METYTVLACDVNETKSIQPILHGFDEKKKLYLCIGVNKVGKTAFSFKILNVLLQNEIISCKPVVIAFDDTMDYWQRKFQNKMQFLHPFRNKKEVLVQEIIDSIEKEVLPTSANFILLDGLSNYAFVWDLEDFKKLIAYLTNLIQTKQVNVFITYRSCKELFPFQFLGLKENDLVEFWNLERPEYFEKEFGETILETI